jgi:hypothetical protein
MNLNITELTNQYNSMTDAELENELKDLQGQSLSPYDVDGKKAENLAKQKVIVSLINTRKGTSNTHNTSQYGTNANYQPQPYAQPSQEASGGVNGGQVALGVLLLVAGIGISMASEGSIFYGLMIVGVITIVKGLMG